MTMIYTKYKYRNLTFLTLVTFLLAAVKAPYHRVRHPSVRFVQPFLGRKFFDGNNAVACSLY